MGLGTMGRPINQTEASGLPVCELNPGKMLSSLGFGSTEQDRV